MSGNKKKKGSNKGKGVPLITGNKKATSVQRKGTFLAPSSDWVYEADPSEVAESLDFLNRVFKSVVEKMRQGQKFDEDDLIPIARKFTALAPGTTFIDEDLEGFDKNDPEEDKWVQGIRALIGDYNQEPGEKLALQVLNSEYQDTAARLAAKQPIKDNRRLVRKFLALNPDKTKKAKLKFLTLEPNEVQDPTRDALKPRLGSLKTNIKEEITLVQPSFTKKDIKPIKALFKDEKKQSFLERNLDLWLEKLRSDIADARFKPAKKINKGASKGIKKRTIARNVYRPHEVEIAEALEFLNTQFDEVLDIAEFDGESAVNSISDDKLHSISQRFVALAPGTTFSDDNLTGFLDLDSLDSRTRQAVEDWIRRVRLLIDYYNEALTDKQLAIAALNAKFEQAVQRATTNEPVSAVREADETNQLVRKLVRLAPGMSFKDSELNGFQDIELSLDEKQRVRRWVQNVRSRLAQANKALGVAPEAQPDDEYPAIKLLRDAFNGALDHVLNGEIIDTDKNAQSVIEKFAQLSLAATYTDQQLIEWMGVDNIPKLKKHQKEELKQWLEWFRRSSDKYKKALRMLEAKVREVVDRAANGDDPDGDDINKVSAEFVRKSVV